VVAGAVVFALMCPGELIAKDPDIPAGAAPSVTTPPEDKVEGEMAEPEADRQGPSSTTAGPPRGRGWEPEYDANAPPGPYGGLTEETPAPTVSSPGRTPAQSTCVTASGAVAPCAQPSLPYVVGPPRMAPGYAPGFGAYRVRPRGIDNRGGGGRN